MSIRSLFMLKFTKYINVYKKEGFKGVIKIGGWKVIGIFSLFF